MGLDQEIFVETSWRPEGREYEQILRKRKCFPRHAFIDKWLVDTYKVNLLTWKSLPFGPYIEIPRMVVAQYCTALEKRNKSGSSRTYKIWSKIGKSLKIAIGCPKTIPPLVRDEFEKLIPTNIPDKIYAYVGGRCKYDHMFGASLEQEDWDNYTDQEEDIQILRQALESSDHIEIFHYYASW